MVSTAKFLNTKTHVDYMTKNYSRINLSYHTHLLNKKKKTLTFQSFWIVRAFA